MTCAIVTIGTELTRGDLRDKNGHLLASRLTDLGYEVVELCSVDDNEDRIAATLMRLAETHTFVFVTGGLGPTTDDLTSASAARALGVPLVRDEKAYFALANNMTTRGRTLTASSAKQTDFPQGALVLENVRGTAPGFSITLRSCQFFFMPGVPAEMEPMFETEVQGRLPAPTRITTCLRLQTFGLPEVEVNDRLFGIETKYEVLLGYRASLAQIEVKVLATARPGESPTELFSRARAATDIAKARLSDALFAEGTSSLPEALGALLCQKQLTLGLAESCTGGQASQLLTSVSGASEYFMGSVVSYDDSAKENVLGVSREILQKEGAVSEPVARQMAEGALTVLQTDLVLALTGIAGPTGGTPEKPVGLVHFAIASQAETVAFSQVFRGTRTEIQHRAALTGLFHVRNLVRLLPDPDEIP